jgi:glutamate 5-kinase
MKPNDLLKNTKRLIVKVGSALVVDSATGQARIEWLNALADDLVSLQRHGIEICLVSSGAIALGRESLGIALDKASKSIVLEKKQAAASVGQIRLCQIYQDIFRARGAQVAQILLSPSDTEDRKSHLNARAAIGELLKLNIIPVINENDTTATEEIRFGDNDKLAARVSQMIAADCLLILSTTDGLYTDDPRIDPNARHIPFVESLNPETMALAKDALSGLSTGGMKSKIESARIAISAGTHVVIAKGVLNPVQALLSGDGLSTVIAAREKPQAARKRWIQAHIKPKGRVMIDDGAVRALSEGRSLLPAGIRQVDGTFDTGDAVQVFDMMLNAVAVGLARYDADEAERIRGRKTSEIPDILGYSGHDEFIHRDDLSLLE